MTFRLPLRSLMLLLVTGALLAGCSSDDDEPDDTPTAAPPTQAASTPAGQSTVAATPKPGAATAAPATFASGTGQIVTDGICQATVPDDWVDNGTGRGTTAGGARYSIFGNIIRTDDAWNQAVKLVKDAAAQTGGANVTEGDRFVRVDAPDDKGFEYRGRFADRYCDFSVTSSSAIPEEERAVWDAIIASLGPVAT